MDLEKFTAVTRKIGLNSFHFMLQLITVLTASSGDAGIRAAGEGGIEMTGRDWKTTIRLRDATLTVEQTPAALAADGLSPLALGNVHLSMRRTGANQAAYTLE